MIPPEQFNVPTATLQAFCAANGIRRVAVFGSALRGDFGPDSDVDLLIEFEPGRTPGLEYFSLQRQLSQIFGRAVDLCTPNAIRPAFRDAILSTMEDLYVAA